MKAVIVCDKHSYIITDDDYERLKRVSPNFARMVKESRDKNATHYVCEQCGQIPPVKLRELHKCAEGE